MTQFKDTTTQLPEEDWRKIWLREQAEQMQGHTVYPPVVASRDLDRALKDNQINHPPYYTDGGIETIDFIVAKGLNYFLGNVVKYVSRAGKKSPDALTDLKKAKFYLDREIERLEKK
jgi:hypothetical protein